MFRANGAASHHHSCRLAWEQVLMPSLTFHFSVMHMETHRQIIWSKRCTCSCEWNLPGNWSPDPSNPLNSIMHAERSLSNFRTTSGYRDLRMTWGRSKVSEWPVPRRLRPQEHAGKPQAAAFEVAMEALPEALAVWKLWDFNNSKVERTTLVGPFQRSRACFLGLLLVWYVNVGRTFDSGVVLHFHSQWPFQSDLAQAQVQHQSVSIFGFLNARRLHRSCYPWPKTWKPSKGVRFPKAWELAHWVGTWCILFCLFSCLFFHLQHKVRETCTCSVVAISVDRTLRILYQLFKEQYSMIISTFGQE